MVIHSRSTFVKQCVSVSGQIGLLVCMKENSEGEAVSPLEPKKLHYQDGDQSGESPTQYVIAFFEGF